MTKTIAISNQKGGVAKTTTCLSLGAALAEMGHSVLLIDLDPQANLTLSLGFNPKQLDHTVLDALMGDSSLVGVSRETSVFALDLVPANSQLTLVDRVFYGMTRYQFRLKKRIDEVFPGLYEYILLDCPPYLAPLTLNALTAADLQIIPVQCEVYTAHSLRQVIGFARQMRERINTNLDYRVLITMYDGRNRISRLILEQLQQELSQVLLETIIQVDVKLKECSAWGKPITSYAPRSRAAQQYRALADELLGTIPSAGSGLGTIPISSRSEAEWTAGSGQGNDVYPLPHEQAPDAIDSDSNESNRRGQTPEADLAETELSERKHG
jgi:chromosome partitioning protein